MKRAILSIFILTLAASEGHAQWQPDSIFQTYQVMSFLPANTNLFVILENVTFRFGDTNALFLVKPDGTLSERDLNHYLFEGGGGVTSMVGIGPYILAADNGAIIQTSDLGYHWVGVGKDSTGNWVTSGYSIAAMGRVVITGSYRSTDSGKLGSWKYLKAPNFTQMAVIGSNIVGGSPYGRWYSSDSGLTWTLASNWGSGSFAIIDSTIYCDGFPISRSTDFGETWSTVPSGASPGGGSPIAAWGHYLFAGVYDDVSATYGVNVSSDRGSNWHTDNKGLHDLWTAKPGKIKVTALGVSDSQLWVNFTLSNDYRWSTFHRPISELIDTTAGIVQQIPSGDSIEIYPNPTMERVTILSGGTSILAVRVLNVLGEEVRSDEDRVLNDVTIDLSKVPSGTYFVEIETPDGTVLRKLVKE